jgi:ABC-type transporter Mla subunit MlaD
LYNCEVTTPMTQASELSEAIARSRERVAYAEKELERFLEAADSSAPQTARQQAKLEDDLRRAQNDLDELERALADARPELRGSEAKAFVEGVEAAEDA